MKAPALSSLESRTLYNGSLYSRFLLGPIPIDLSLSVATTLRRGLLHSQPSFGIVSAEIEGAVHEYAALPGIQESVLELLLNLGEVVLTTTHRNILPPHFRNRGLFLQNNSGIYFASIRNSGPGIIRAKDINWPHGIYCVNPDAQIATLSNNATLAMRIKITATVSPIPVTSDLEFPSWFKSMFASILLRKEQLRKEKELALRKPVVSQSPVARFLPKDAQYQQSREQVLASYVRRKRQNSKFVFFPKPKNLNLPTKKSKQNLSRKREKELGIRILRSGLDALDLTTYSIIQNIIKKIKKSKLKPFEKPKLFLNKKKEYTDVARIRAEKSKELFFSIKKPSDVLNTVVDKPKLGVELSVSSSSYPVHKVNFVIERDDQWEGYRHRIILEVWTNGSISPLQALFDSIEWSMLLVYNFREPTSLPFGEKFSTREKYSIPGFDTRN